jgi:hypothetical protein
MTMPNPKPIIKYLAMKRVNNLLVGLPLSFKSNIAKSIFYFLA